MNMFYNENLLDGMKCPYAKLGGIPNKGVVAMAGDEWMHRQPSNRRTYYGHTDRQTQSVSRFTSEGPMVNDYRGWKFESHYILDRHRLFRFPFQNIKKR